MQTRAARDRASSVTHKSAVTDHAVKENYVIDWEGVKVIEREEDRPDKVDQGGAVYPEDKEYHEPGHRDLSTKPHMRQSDFRVT